MYAVNDHKGAGILLLNDGKQRGVFRHGKGDHQNPFSLAGESAGCFDHGSGAIKLFDHASVDLLATVGHDMRHKCGATAEEYFIHHNGGNGGVPEFFTDIFRSDEFCEEFIARWKEISPLIMTEVWDNTEKYITAAEDAMIRNSERWPIYFPSDSWPEDEIDFEEEIDNLYVWLTERIDYLTPIFNKYLQLD